MAANQTITKVNTDDLSDKIIKGLDISFKKPVKEKAKDDEELVFEENGKIIKVKARDLLKKMNIE